MKKLFVSLLLTLLAAGAWAANPVVEMQTSAGKIVIELNPEQSPKTVENFLLYVKDDFYRGTVFHRVINGFMIQGGGFNAKLEQKSPRDPIENEASNGLKNERGTIAMARTNDPNSATAQFFINLVDNRLLDYPKPDGYGYAVFGKVTHGMEVVDRIAKVATGNHPAGHRNVPLAPVVIQSVKLQKDK